ncbi:MAG: hypothetical protein V4689_00510 [Verrucomicrobiota bacterium]
MPAFWQITEARGLQTQGVWALSPDFTVGKATLASHEAGLGALRDAATALEDLDNLLDAADADLRAEYDYFKAINPIIAGRLGGELADEDPLLGDIGQLWINPSSRPAIEQRTLKTATLWVKINAARAAEIPPQPEVVVRLTTAAAYQARWEALPAKRLEREAAAGAQRTGNSLLKAADKALDRTNKDWHQAWKSEFPAGTPEGDALAGVATAKSTPRPEVLEIATISQEGLSLRVTYVAGSGKHATVRMLDYQVEGVDGDFQQVAAEVAAGNVIGPFLPGQSVRVRTDVGNSRARSRRSAEQVVTISGAE